MSAIWSQRYLKGIVVFYKNRAKSCILEKYINGIVCKNQPLNNYEQTLIGNILSTK